MIRVEILEQNRAALRPFVMLPFSLYREDPNWVAPLIGRQLKQLAPICRALQVQPWQVICYSSENGDGRDQLLEALEKALTAQDKPKD